MTMEMNKLLYCITVSEEEDYISEYYYIADDSCQLIKFEFCQFVSVRKNKNYLACVTIEK